METIYNFTYPPYALYLPLIVILTFFKHDLQAQVIFKAQKESLSKTDQVQEAGQENFSTYSIDLHDLNKYLQSNILQGSIKLTMEVENKNWELELEPNDQRGITGKPFYKCHAFKGIANKGTGNWVRLYVHENYIGGYVTIDDTRYYFNTPFKSKKQIKKTLFTISEKPYNKNRRDIAEGSRNECNNEASVELGVYVDYQAYLDHNSIEEDIIMHIEDLLNVVQGFYFEKTGWTINILIRGTTEGEPVIWTEPDNFCCPQTIPLRYLLNQDWDLHRPCIPKDAIFLFSGQTLHTGLGSTGGALCNTAPNSPTSQINPFVPTNVNETNIAEAFVFAHEFGHLLGFGHIENQCLTEAEYCDLPCPNPNESALMCKYGTCPRDIGIAFLDICSEDEFLSSMPNNCEGCLGAPQPMPTCEICVETGMITADNASPIIGCESQDIVNYKVTICNSCNGQYLDVQASYSTLQAEYLPSDPSDWPTIESYLTTNFLTSNDVWFEGEECKDFYFTLKIIDNSQTGSIPSNVKINGNTANSISVFPIEEIIGDVNGESLEDLIINNTLWQEPISCDAEVQSGRRRFIISGILKVDVPYCMDQYALSWEPGAQIVVKSGVELTIKNSTIKGCEGMGKGILVEDGATLNIEYSTIEDAQYAIRALGASRLSITNSNFNRNFVGLYIGDAGWPGLTTFDVFYGNTFNGGDGLLPPYTGQSSDPAGAINSEAFAGVWINNKSNLLHSLSNTFRNMSNGIYARSTNLKITDNNFKEIWENGYNDFLAGHAVQCSGSGNYSFQMAGFGSNIDSPETITSCSKAITLTGVKVDYIKNCKISAKRGIALYNTNHKASIGPNTIRAWQGNGIELHQIPPATLLFVQSNKIEVKSGNGIGIQANMAGITPSSVKHITGNEIYITASKAKGIESNAGNGTTIVNNEIYGNETDGYTGIAINSDYNSDIRCNTISSDQLVTAAIGIRVWDGEVSHFNCNKIRNTGLGLSFSMGSMSPENVRENTFNNNGTGLHLAASAALGAQTHTGNQWEGTFGNYGAQHESSLSSDWFASLFTVHQASPGTYRPTLPSGQTSWFATNLGGTPSDDCENITACLLTVPPDTPNDDGLAGLDTDISNGLFATTAYGTEMGRLAKRYLYRKLSKYPGLITASSKEEDFMIGESSTVVGEYWAVEDGIKTMYEIAAPVKGQLDTGFTDVATQMEAIGLIDSLLLEGYGDSLLLVERDSIIGTVASGTALLDTMLVALLAQRASDAEAVATQNAAIASGSLMDENERTVNDIFLNTVAKDSLIFDTVQVADLQDIAKQCPLTGGTAVFRARSLLALVSNEYYDDEELCEEAEEREKLESHKNAVIPDFSLFPNPTNGLVTLLIPDGREGTLSLIARNSLGRTVLQEEIPFGKSPFSFSIKGFAPGTYLITVHQNRNQLFAEKLVVLR